MCADVRQFIDMFSAGEVDCTTDADGLYRVDSLLDFVCRGASRELLIDLFNVDCGYHLTQTSKATRGIDRQVYKLTHVRVRCGVEFTLSVIDAYAMGANRESCLAMFGIADKRITLRNIAAEVGLSDTFDAADITHRKNAMRTGMLAKYGVDNPFKLNEFQAQAKATRIDRYGAPYTLCEESTLCDAARNTLNMKLQDGGFRALLNLKRMLTRFERTGYVYPRQAGSEACHVLALPSGRTLTGKRSAWDREDRLAKARATSLARFGADHHSKTDAHRSHMTQLWAEHGHEWSERRDAAVLEKYGVGCVFELPEHRRRQSERMLDPEYQKHIREVCKAHGVEGRSKAEDRMYTTLCSLFGASDVHREYRDEERYPYFCDFYVASRDMFIELNGHPTHGRHWFDSDDDLDCYVLSHWIELVGSHFHSGPSVWAGRDVAKRYCAEQYELNYLVFWDGANAQGPLDFNLWVAMGAPDGCDFECMYSWLPTHHVMCDGAGSYAAVWWANQYSDFALRWWGTPQMMVYAKWYAQRGLLPWELTFEQVLDGVRKWCC